jgi:hypothetical protein
MMWWCKPDLEFCAAFQGVEFVAGETEMALPA